MWILIARYLTQAGWATPHFTSFAKQTAKNDINVLDHTHTHTHTHTRTISLSFIMHLFLFFQLYICRINSERNSYTKQSVNRPTLLL